MFASRRDQLRRVDTGSIERGWREAFALRAEQRRELVTAEIDPPKRS